MTARYAEIIITRDLDFIKNVTGYDITPFAWRGYFHTFLDFTNFVGRYGDANLYTDGDNVVGDPTTVSMLLKKKLV